MHRYVASVGACVPEHGSTQRCFKLDMDDVTLLTLRHHSMRIDPVIGFIQSITTRTTMKRVWYIRNSPVR